MKIDRYGKIVDYAQCDNCSWDYTAIDGHKRKNIYYHIKKHVESTGHTINREAGNHTTYSL